MKHTLDLRENAADSFDEALTKYREGHSGQAKAFKFAILHLAHSLELLLKYYVSRSHPLLIYKNPFSKDLKKENTIGLWDAVQFLANEGKALEDDFVADLKWIKALRNDIEHYQFDMDVSTVRKTMGRLVQAITEFHADVSEDDDIEDFVSKANMPLYQELADENARERGLARTAAKEKTEDGEVYDCPSCGYKGTAAKIGQAHVCQYCEEVDTLANCCICGVSVLRSEAQSWNEEFDEYACDGCVDRVRNMD